MQEAYEGKMGDCLFRALLFDDVAVASTGSAETEILPLRGVERIESLMFKATSATGDADVQFQYAVSPDGVEFGAYDDADDILASSAALDSPEGWNFVAMPNVLAPYVKVKVTGVGTNPADTVVRALFLLREGY